MGGTKKKKKGFSHREITGCEALLNKGVSELKKTRAVCGDCAVCCVLASVCVFVCLIGTAAENGAN
jgi:hypothetical protein